MWRQTGNCNATGEREPERDRLCSESVPLGNSGFCDCNGDNEKNGHLSKPEVMRRMAGLDCTNSFLKRARFYLFPSRKQRSTIHELVYLRYTWVYTRPAGISTITSSFALNVPYKIFPFLNDCQFRRGDERGYDCQSTPGSCDAVCPQVPQESRYDSRLSS